MRALAIDLGSNSLKYTLARLDPSLPIEILEENEFITRISEGVESSGFLGEAAMSRTFEKLQDLASLSRSCGVVRCVATASLRGPQNAEAFVRRVRNALGLQIEVIDGLQEAALAFSGSGRTWAPKQVMVIDIGGRSTELVLGRFDDADQPQPSLQARVSLPLGGVRLTERFSDLERPETFGAFSNHVRSTLTQAPALPQDAVLVGVSGTILALMGLQMGVDHMIQVIKEGHGKTLQRSSIEAALRTLGPLSPAQRLRGSVIPEGRADVIVASAALLLQILAHCGRDSLFVSRFGLRMGLLQQIRAELI